MSWLSCADTKKVIIMASISRVSDGISDRRLWSLNKSKCLVVLDTQIYTKHM